jgi:hypothetical protein
MASVLFMAGIYVMHFIPATGIVVEGAFGHETRHIDSNMAEW